MTVTSQCRAARRCIALIVGQAVIAAVSSPAAAGDHGHAESLKFAAEMAEDGNWREARFRWDKASVEAPENPRILNNLAVAAEALGDFDAARDYYDRALRLPDADEKIQDNTRQFERYLRRTQGVGDEKGDDPPAPLPPAASDKRSGGRALRLPVRLPVPPRINLASVRAVLVTSFLVDDGELLDANRELVRFVRAELRKGTAMEILDITPAPAIPEQSLDELAANREFWKHLGARYDSDLLISGALRYDRRDASGFESVDYTSAATGQKVRRSEFVEQERFEFQLDLLFVDGRSGEILDRDRLARASIFRGQNNDPITAFFQLGESIAGELLAAVRPSTREEFRFLFKR